VAGEPKQTPTGRALPGIFEQSYWVSRVAFSAKKGFKEPIGDIVELLSKHKCLLLELKDTGGTIELYLQLPGSFNNGDTMESSILETIGGMGINLSIEVFPRT
jgi:hypothetical protein